MRRAVFRTLAAAVVLTALSGCTLLGNRPGTTQPSGLATSTSPGAVPTDGLPSLTNPPATTTQGVPSQLPIRLLGRTQVWNGNTQRYETVAEFTRDAELFFVTKQIGGGTAFAIMSGQLLEEKAGAMLFATNTAALRDIPAINRNVVTASIDVAGMDIDNPAAGRFHATVDEGMARAVTVLYFQIRDGANSPPKQILTGTVSLRVEGTSVAGEFVLEGADFVGGAHPVDRYVATITSP